MPTPEGVITGTEIWTTGEKDSVNNQTVEETQEEIPSETTDATE